MDSTIQHLEDWVLKPIIGQGSTIEERFDISGEAGFFRESNSEDFGFFIELPDEVFLMKDFNQRLHPTI